MSGVRERMSHRLTADRLRLEVERATRPFLVLVAVLALGLTALALLFVKLKVTLPWQDRYEVRVAVADARGVVAGSNEVRIAGVVVGKIAGVDFERGHAVLTAEIEPRFAPLHRDARLRLRPKTPLEDMYLNVEDRGTGGAGKVPDGGLLAAERTRTPVAIGDVVNVFDADVRPRIARAIEGLGRGLGDHGEQLRAALTELAPFLRAAQGLTREIAVRERHTRALVTNFAALSDELARRDGQVSTVVKAGAGVLGELAAAERPLAATIEELPPTLERLPSSFATLRRAAGELDGALVALRPAARALPEGLAAARTLAPELRTAARGLRRPLPALARLARTLVPLSTDLQAALGSLRSQAPALDRVTAAVVPCRLAVAKFFQFTLSVGKYYDTRGVALRGDPIAQPSMAAGSVPDPGLTSKPDCAAGGPRK